MDKPATSDKPLVSVIVLTYNQEAYIARNLDAILSQQVSFPYEIVLGDDASTDGTPAICRDYATRYPDRVVLQLNESNKGVTRNYMDCLRLCRGEFIADCGGDDFWIDPLKMQREVDALREHPSASLAYANWKTFHEETQTFSSHNEFFTESFCREEDFGVEAVACFLSRRMQPEVVLSAACYRKQVVLEAYDRFPKLFEGEDCVAEDIPVTAFLLNAGPAVYLAHEHLAYRVLKESVSHSTDSARYHRFVLACLRQTLEVAKALQLPPSSVAGYAKTKYDDLMHYAWLSRTKDMAVNLRQLARENGLRQGWKNHVKYALLWLIR